MTQYIAHCGRRDVGELLRSRDYYGFNLGSETAVGIRDAALVFEVEHVPDAPDYVAYAELAADVYGEPVVIDDLHSLHAGCGLADDIQFLLRGEEPALVLVDTYSYDDLVEHREGAAEYIEMPFGKRIEGPRE